MSWKFGARLLDNPDSFLVAISEHFVYVTSLPLPSKRWGLDRRKKKNTAIIDLIHPPEEVKHAQLQFHTRHTEKTQYSHLIWEIPLGEGVLWTSRARFPAITVWQCISLILDSGKADGASLATSLKWCSPLSHNKVPHQKLFQPGNIRKCVWARGVLATPPPAHTPCVQGPLSWACDFIKKSHNKFLLLVLRNRRTKWCWVCFKLKQKLQQIGSLIHTELLFSSEILPQTAKNN